MGRYGSQGILKENMGVGRMGATAVEPSAVSATSLLLSELELASMKVNSPLAFLTCLY